MKAILLAAGRGSRLAPYTDDRPKSLVEIGGTTLLEHSLTSLRAAGIADILLVAGYLHHAVEEAVTRRFASCCRVLINPDYTKGSGSSLLRAADDLVDDILLLEADLLYHQSVLARMLDSTFECGLAMGRFGHAGIEGKIRLADGYVQSLTWGGPEVSADGDWVGITRLSRAAAHALGESLRRAVVPKDGELQYASFIIRLLRQFRFKGVWINDLPWIEVDNENDLLRARAEVFPQLIQLNGPAPLRRDAPYLTTASCRGGIRGG
jgi:choline kinase